MKKLMIAFAAVAMVTVGNAAAMRWSSGTLYTPASAKDGTFTTTQISDLNTVVAVLWESTTSFSQLDAGKLYAAYKDGTTADTFASANATVKTGGNSQSAYSVNLTTGTKYNTGTSVYAAILYVYDDGANTYYIENYAQNTAASAIKATNYIATKIGGDGVTSGAAISGWTPVPEPTSGLLLVFGMAGLALKRKRA